jgi:hypothetical protein
MGVPPRQPQDLVSEAHLNSTSQGELVLPVPGLVPGSVVEETPEYARLPARLRPVGDYAPEGRAYSSERRTVISAVAAGHS